MGISSSKRRASSETILEEIANEYMKTDSIFVQKYGVNPNEELAEDLPHFPEEQKKAQDHQLQETIGGGEKIRWQKGCILGEGAYGKVYLGLNLDNGELIAVKEINLAEQQSEREMEAIQREVGILSTLRHDNIVQYYGACFEKKTLQIFLEYVPGGSIASLLIKFGPLNEQVIAAYTRQILLGLVYLHKHKILHRDIKGANILVDNNGVVKLADFGASKRILTLKSTDGRSVIRGTPYWMAPEVIKQMKVSSRADVWSVGCTVIEMATGLPPWHEFSDQVSALFHIAKSNKTPSLPENLSSSAHEFLLACFKRDPDKRPSAAQLLEYTFVLKTNLSNLFPTGGPSVDVEALMTQSFGNYTSLKSKKAQNADTSGSRGRSNSSIRDSPRLSRDSSGNGLNGMAVNGTNESTTPKRVQTPEPSTPRFSPRTRPDAHPRSSTENSSTRRKSTVGDTTEAPLSARLADRTSAMLKNSGSYSDTKSSIQTTTSFSSSRPKNSHSRSSSTSSDLKESHSENSRNRLAESAGRTTPRRNPPSPRQTSPSPRQSPRQSPISHTSSNPSSPRQAPPSIITSSHFSPGLQSVNSVREVKPVLLEAFGPSS